MTPFFGRLLRRLDLSVLYIMALILMLRTAVRTEEDHRAGWLSPVVAAGAPRWRYGVVLVLTEMLVPTAIFTAVAVSFALGVQAFDNTSELIRALPATLGAGVLLLGTYAACATVIGIALHQVAATVVITALLTTMPLFLAWHYASAGLSIPAWLSGFSLLAPVVIPPPDVINALRAILYIIGAGVLAGYMSHRHAGRQT